MSNKRHFLNALSSILEASGGLVVAARHADSGQQSDYIFNCIHNALIAAEECRQALRDISDEERQKSMESDIEEDA